MELEIYYIRDFIQDFDFWNAQLTCGNYMIRLGNETILTYMVLVIFSAISKILVEGKAIIAYD